MIICQGCKQPIIAAAYTVCRAPDGSTWYMHLRVAACVAALLGAARRAAEGERRAA